MFEDLSGSLLGFISKISFIRYKIDFYVKLAHFRKIGPGRAYYGRVMQFNPENKFSGKK